MTCLILGASPCSFVTGSVVCIKGRLKARKHAGRNFHQQLYHHKAPSNSGQEHAAIQQADGWQSSVQTTLSAHHIWEAAVHTRSRKTSERRIKSVMDLRTISNLQAWETYAAISINAYGTYSID